MPKKASKVDIEMAPLSKPKVKSKETISSKGSIVIKKEPTEKIKKNKVVPLKKKTNTVDILIEEMIKKHERELNQLAEKESKQE
jgi:hypothetical protein